MICHGAQAVSANRCAMFDLGQKRTFGPRNPMSALCQKQSSAIEATPPGKRLKLIHSFRRAHELECLNNLFAVRMLVNLARGTVGEFVRAKRRNRIAEH